MNDKFTIRLADWHLPTDQTALKKIRTTVFVNEQQVPPILEWDEDDASAVHLLACDDHANAIACARLILRSDLNQQVKQCSGKIGRMAVLAEWRNQGVGTALLHRAIRYFHQHEIHHITLSAQTHAVGFYQRAGFVASSLEYQDAGIPHVDMQLVN